MTTVAITNTTASDEQHAINVIVLAFSADPAARRMFPYPTQYLRHFSKFVKAFGGKALRPGPLTTSTAFLARRCGCRRTSILTTNRWPP